MIGGLLEAFLGLLFGLSLGVFLGAWLGLRRRSSLTDENERLRLALRDLSRRAR